MQTGFDHLVIAAETLAEGQDWLSGLLGVSPEPGGAHGFMGTHNRLWRLGPREYIELIAIDPSGTKPPYPRWFGLDDFTGGPRLITWVIRAHPLIAPPGSSIMRAARGDLRWQITIPDGGYSASDGLAPLMIDWGDGPHPADLMPDHGLRLTALTITHPQPPAPPSGDPRIAIAPGPAAMIRARITTPTRDIAL